MDDVEPADDPVEEADVGTPEPSLPEWEESPPVVNLDEPRDSAGQKGLDPSTEQPTDQQGSEPKPDADGRLEDSDPESSSVDDGGARTTRIEGLRTLNQLPGDRPQVYQAAKMNFFAREATVMPRRGPVPTTILRQMKTTFVESASHRELIQRLRHSPLQFYVGVSRTGRTTMALATASLFLEQTGRRYEGNVHLLPADRGVSGIETESIPDDSALVLPVSQGDPSPDPASLAAVESDLRTKRSVLIIVTDVEPTGPSTLLNGWIVAHEPPSPEEVLRRHLGARLPKTRVDALLAVPAISIEILDCRTPRAAATLAADILTGIEDGVSDKELVASREPTDELSRAYNELATGQYWKRMFLIAATVLDGQTAGTVTREASRFADLHKAGDEDPGVWFVGSGSEWSECVDLVGEPTGDGKGRLVRLVHPRLSTRLLQAIWQDHLGERDVLIAWLRPLGAHPHSAVRVRAAQAAAQLACYDFDFLVRELLHVWAIDGGFRTRQTCSWALEALALAADGRFAAQVRGLVRSWAGSNNIQLLATAASAYGTFLGAQDPDEALQRLRRIVGQQVLGWDGRRIRSLDRFERGLANIVEQALLEVFTAGAEEKVIQELVRWTVSPRWRWRRAAARTLIRLSARNGQNAQWPLLAELAAAQPETRTAVACLWRNALNPRQRDEHSWEALRRWIQRAAAAEDPSLRALIEEILADIRSDADIAKRLDFHQRIWKFRASRTSGGPDAATTATSL